MKIMEIMDYGDKELSRTLRGSGWVHTTIQMKRVKLFLHVTNNYGM
jgi:hypothetical protein